MTEVTERVSRERQGTHPKLRNVGQGSHVRMCRSCYRENAAWVLRDQSGGYRRCPFSSDPWEPLPLVVGIEWKEKYARMIDTVGSSSLIPKARVEASATHLSGAVEPRMRAEA